MNKKKKSDISGSLVKNSVELSEHFRENLLFYVGKNNMTMVELANKSGIPINTINSFLHRISNDMKISNVARIAKTLNISIDELISSDTMHDLTKESLALCRNLPENDLYLVRWFIRYLHGLNTQNEPNKRYISVMEVECNSNGNLKITSQYRHVDITDVDCEIKGKAFFGITIPCDHYMPIYSPYDILLIANDRFPTAKENCLIRMNGLLHIAKRNVENSVPKYYSIRDGKYRVDESDIDEIIGYIAYVKRESTPSFQIQR